MSSGPMSAVLGALREGCVSREEIARRTNLSPMTIDAVMAHLEATGEVQRRALNDSCAGGCGGCPRAGRARRALSRWCSAGASLALCLLYCRLLTRSLSAPTL